MRTLVAVMLLAAVRDVAAQPFFPVELKMAAEIVELKLSAEAMKLDMSRLATRLASVEQHQTALSSVRQKRRTAPASHQAPLGGESRRATPVAREATSVAPTTITDQSVETCTVRATCELILGGEAMSGKMRSLADASEHKDSDLAAGLAAALDAHYPFTTADDLGEDVSAWGHPARVVGPITAAVTDNGTYVGACFPAHSQGSEQTYFAINATVLRPQAFSVSMRVRLTSVGHESLFIINGVTTSWSQAVFWLFTSHTAEEGIHDDDDAIVNGTSRRHFAAVVNRYDTRYYDHHFDYKQTLTAGTANAHFKVGEWVHVVASYEYAEDALSGTYRLFMDGQQINQFLGVPLIAAADLEGKDILVGDSGYYGCNGIVRDMRIYSKALGRDEVRYLHDTTAFTDDTSVSTSNEGGCWEYVKPPTPAPTANPGWVAAVTPLLNSWVTRTSAYKVETVRYMKDSHGFVHVDGMVTGGTDGTAVFQLPEFYRPDSDQELAATIGPDGSNAFGSVEVLSTGFVIVKAGGGSWCSLSGLSFASHNIATTWTAYTSFLNGWTAIQPVRHTKDAEGFCHLDGMLGNGVMNTNAFYIPMECWPEFHQIILVSGNGYWGRINIYTDGQVYMNTGTALSSVYQMSLAGVSWAPSTMTWDASFTSFANGWQQYSADYAAFRYVIDAAGIVHTDGLLASGTLGKCLMTATAFGPNFRKIGTVSSNAFGSLAFYPGGCVEVYSGSTTWVSFSGVTFAS
jgi:hypothetical protein